MPLSVTQLTGSSSAAPITPPSNGSWAQPLWAIDPVNGSDRNDGSLAHPVKNYASIAARWGTVAPVLRADTRLVFLSSQTDDTDPIVWNPVSELGTVSIEGTPTTVTAGVVLAGVVAKSTAAGANTLLKADLGATAAQDMIVANRTRGSVARVYKVSSGTVWEVSQPFLAASVGQAPTAQDNGWANGDVVDLLTPTSINLVQCEPSIGTAGGTGQSQYAYLYRTKLFVPAGALGASTRLGQVRVYEGSVARKVAWTSSYTGSPSPFNGPCFFNVANANSMLGMTPPSLVGGYHRAGAIQIPAAWLDSYICGSAITTYVAAQTFLNAEIYLDNANLIFVNTAVSCLAGVKVYGRAGRTITLQGTARFAIAAGDTFVGALTAPFIVSNGISMNGAFVASSVASGSPSVINGNIATTPANLDAAAGAAGFGGLAFNLGGASIAKAA